MEEINRNEQETLNRATANALYKSLEAGDTKIVSRLLASDLEWWFHDPQNCHHMMRKLTGEAPHTEFMLEPRSVTTIDDQIVIVEGYEGANVYWVHVWALKDGLITRFRDVFMEYFKTWLMVKELRVRLVGWPRSTVWGANHEIFSAGRCLGSCLLFDDLAYRGKRLSIVLNYVKNTMLLL